MRLRHVAGFAVATAITLLGLPALPAAADAPTTLYVNNDPGSQCSDAGTGTQTQPYCTISAAAKVVQPGQTVRVTPSRFGYQGEVDLTRSGTPDQPITFVGSNPDGSPGATIQGLYGPGGNPWPHAVSIAGQHDITFAGFGFTNALQPVSVTDSSRVTVDNNVISARLTIGAQLPYPASVVVSGHSDHVSITRNEMEAGFGVSVSAGAQSTLISTNEIGAINSGPALTVADAPGTVITNNTIGYQCHGGVSLTGASSGASVQNNIIVSDSNCTTGSGTLISLSADSVVQSTVDYNIVHPLSGQSSYSWAGTGYSSPAALQSATGQAPHDVDSAVRFDNIAGTHVGLLEGSAAVDSANAQAPGVLATDLVGHAPVDDPTVANTGVGAGGFRDRGAVEFVGLQSVSLSLSGAQYLSAQGPAPLAVTAHATASNRWNTTLTYTYDFGDGTAPVVTTQAQFSHTYLTPGTYTASVTVTDGVGGTVTAAAPTPVVATDLAPLAPVLTVRPASQLLTYSFTASVPASTWRVTTYALDFGDGTTGSGASTTHTYQTPGTYTATLTVTDEAGRSQEVQQVVQAAAQPGGFVALTPSRLVDTRLPFSSQSGKVGPGGSIVIAPALPVGATAVVLNVTATDATADTHIDVSPALGSGTSSLNLSAGATVANLVTVPLSPNGYVYARNNAGSVDLVVDLFGYYTPGAAGKFTATTPARLLDTRPGAPLASEATTAVQVAGVDGVPSDATAAVLNVTAIAPDADGYVSAFADGTANPWTSNLNFTRGQTVPNQVIVPLGADGKVEVFSHGADTQIAVDLFGYYSPEGTGLFTPVTPSRLVDTREGADIPLGANSWLPVGARGVGAAPANATSAVVNVTAIGPDTPSYLAVRADGTGVPSTSNLNLTPGVTVANHVITGLDANGNFAVFNHAGNTHVAVDLFGYFSAG
ncbi:PKD domain-containing protein [Kitasatospora sp. GAS204B]|uniref:PKD domain-containing protein n=1 Tax=unclassified Kitasatospora TaxID=2633591 RepID=UPI0024760642|nr:PKD domain-containing protein [Kitasatospora sp. GAS204B]MDH6117984.1 PKD repeat protein [Kitasatospora sp. GAS204B]